MDPERLLPTLLGFVASTPGAVLQVDGHRDVLEPDGTRFCVSLAATLGEAAEAGLLDLRVHDFMSDDELFAYLASLDVSVLPYRFGTHSGWLEACSRPGHDRGGAQLWVLRGPGTRVHLPQRGGDLRPSFVVARPRGRGRPPRPRPADDRRAAGPAHGHRGLPRTALPPAAGRPSRGRGRPNRRRRRAMAARAALLPGAPCTPPPGWAEAEARNSPRIERLGAAQAGDRAEDQLLVQLRGAAVDGAADEVLVAGLEVVRTQDAASQDPGAETGGELLDPPLHAVGEPLLVGVVPAAADPLVAGVAQRWTAGRGCRPTSTRCPRASGSGRRSSSGRRAGTGRPARPGPRPGRAPRRPARGSRRRARCRGSTAAATPTAPGRPAPSRP